MKFKEFREWCNERACDGCWGMKEAMICVAICEDMYKKPFWKREKIWREDCEKSVVSQIVEPINQKIKEAKEIENLKEYKHMYENLCK